MVLDLAVRTGFDAETLTALLAHTLGLIDAALEDAEGIDDDEEGSLDDALPLIEERAQAVKALRKG